MILHRFITTIALLLAVNASPSVKAQASLPENDVRRVTRQLQKLIDVRKARYMEGKCEAATYPGWQGFPLSKCTYTQQGKNDSMPKTATVIMLNAPPEKLARWVVSACIEVKGNSGEKCTNYLLNAINGASSAGQFPVAGLVLEDQLPVRQLPDGKIQSGDGKLEMYAFRDGVTVKVEGVSNGDEQTIPTAAEIQAALTGVVKGTGRYGRIISTTREQYTANGGTVDVGTSEDGKRQESFLTVVRDLYQKAWQSDRNELIIAFARDHRKEL